MCVSENQASKRPKLIIFPSLYLKQALHYLDIWKQDLFELQLLGISENKVSLILPNIILTRSFPIIMGNVCYTFMMCKMGNV